MPPNPDKLNPYVSEEMQDVDLKAIVFGPPRYGSPDPRTNQISLNAAVEGKPTTPDEADKAEKAEAKKSKKKSE